MNMHEKARRDDAKSPRQAHGPATRAIKNEEAKKKTEEPESCTPAPMPAGLEAAMGKGDQGLKIRLQCWDCPGQQEYALLNLLYFAQGIYVVVCDMSEEPERETRVKTSLECSRLFHKFPWCSLLQLTYDFQSAIQR